MDIQYKIRNKRFRQTREREREREKKKEKYRFSNLKMSFLSSLSCLEKSYFPMEHKIFIVCHVGRLNFLSFDFWNSKVVPEIGNMCSVRPNWDLYGAFHYKNAFFYCKTSFVRCYRWLTSFSWNKKFCEIGDANTVRSFWSTMMFQLFSK